MVLQIFKYQMKSNIPNREPSACGSNAQKNLLSEITANRHPLPGLPVMKIVSDWMKLKDTQVSLNARVLKQPLQTAQISSMEQQA